MHVIVRYPTGFYTQTLPSEKEKSLALVYGADLSPHQRSKTKPIDLHWFGPQVWPNNGRNSKITDTHTHTHSGTDGCNCRAVGRKSPMHKDRDPTACLGNDKRGQGLKGWVVNQ